MGGEIGLLGITGILILVFVTLLIVDNYGKRAKFKKLSEKERRAYPRHKIALRIKYKTPLEEGISWIKDISEGGVRIFLNNILKTLEVGESLEVEINLPYDAPSIFIRGNIVWSKDNYAGFSFDEIMQGDIKRMIQYINNEQQVITETPV